MINKITEADLINKGVVGLPDVPGLTTIEMQNKFEEISRDVIIPRFNELIDCTVSASDEFSKLSTYNVGDYCIYQSVLYKCTTEINTAGEWDATKWKATAIDKELKEISSTSENKDAISDKYDSSKTYAVGDYCIYNDTLYKCKTAVTSAEEFDSSKWEATNCGKELVALNSNLTIISDLSLIEHKIGTWIDGKPLYGKYLSCGQIQKGENSIAHGVSNLKFALIDLGLSFWKQGDYASTSGSTYTFTPIYSGISNIYITSERVNFTSGQDFTSFNMYIYIKYTKTTD